MKLLKNLFEDITDFICPRACLVCGRHLRTDDDEVVCPECLQSYETTPFSKDDSNCIVESFMEEGIEIKSGCTFMKFDKKEIVQRILHNLKYFNHPELGIKFGRIAAIRLKEFRDADFILPVPMHSEKLKKRGYNQAEKIADGISEVLKIPVRTDILHKLVNTETQTHKNKAQRLENSMNVYSADRVEEISGCHFLLVDDVFTTGATLTACSRVLKNVMPECKISVFALAKA
jgi:ComF family protein